MAKLIKAKGDLLKKHFASYIQQFGNQGALKVVSDAIVDCESCGNIVFNDAKEKFNDHIDALVTDSTELKNKFNAS